MKALIHRPFRGAGPESIRAFGEFCSSSPAQTQTHPDTIGFGGVDAESGVALRVYLREFLPRLIQRGWFEILGYGRWAHLRKTAYAY
jgi:hypothetical protein